ncbi:glycerate kinase [Alicyclobacillus sp.]|uniref:glycerate kinase n=1 Tax=Alicyclobacillus sp. TaxID=61169 RepID=UPI0025BA8A29|nr:glycerate kinase [Alicyclobacillus sp.]MCL6518121.1 glycerate kinase [Alicyclobacillus sp.]
MRFVVAPDSYKGSLTASEVARIIAGAIREEIPGAEALEFPMADGGEGTVEALVAATGGRLRRMEASGPLLAPVQTAYGELGDGRTAALEVANVAGLTMVPPADRNPLYTSSRGLGELMKAALDEGYRRFIVGLGGSATNDGGMGMLEALGVRFLDASGTPVRPVGGELERVAAVDWSGLDGRIAEADILVASDVDNPLCGPRGASAVFGPQKGATPELVARLDEALSAWSKQVEAACGKRIAEAPGAGAAGGLGFALMALGGRLSSGAAIVAETIGLTKALRAGDWVITGEGQSDHQTLHGKVPYYVAQLAQRCGARPILLSGSLGAGSEALFAAFVSVHAAVPRPMPVEEAMADATALLERAARSIARLIRSASGG